MDSHVVKSYLHAPESFSFPYKPYSIQKEFMSNLYKVLEDGKLGIFESPTGTGKSLSIVCGALCWLKHHENRNVQDIKAAIQKLNIENENAGKKFENDWFSAQTTTRELMDFQLELRCQLEMIEKFDKDILSLKQYAISNRNKNNTDDCSTDNEFTDGEIFDGILTRGECEGDDISADQQQEKDSDETVVGKNRTTSFNRTKIYFCSRTHSQLSQFIVEVKKSPFKDTVNLVPLGSRQNYCINPSVRSLGKLALINERCLEMNETKPEDVITEVCESAGQTVKKMRKKCSSTKCPYIKRDSVVALGKELLADICDIEQLITKGRQREACPYYATRLVSNLAQLIVVPYNSLLHKPTRDALNINLKDNIVIIDEAHNLLDAIGNMYSAEATWAQLYKCYGLLNDYKRRYKNSFGTNSLLYLNQLIYIVGQLTSALGTKSIDRSSSSSSEVKADNAKNCKVFTIIDFTYRIKIDNFNLFEILTFCKRTKIAQKLQTFSLHRSHSDKTSDESSTDNLKLVGVRNFLQRVIESDAQKKRGDTSSAIKDVESDPTTGREETTTSFNMFPILSFIEALTNNSGDGRIVCYKNETIDGGGSDGTLKFLLLNPAAYFKDIIKDARSVIVAGGTMQPISEFRTQLFESAGADKSRIVHYSAGHVIDPDNVLPIVLTAGSSGKKFDFSYEHRNATELIQELGVTLSNLCNIIPAGIVCFFPSYKYEEMVHAQWKNTGILDKISTKKKIFRELKNGSDVETLLNEYAAAINIETQRGALMLSVVGGKLSEGLNFSDDLGRAVVVVGLPYPDNRSPELQEKMNYLDKTMGYGSGRIHYTNLCMKAINQSIGRAIRHKDDYATILLLDHRYSRPNLLEALPSWIKSSVKIFDKFGTSFATVNKFFSSKKRCKK